MWEEQLRKTSFFQGASEAALAELASCAVHRKFRKGSVIFVQGEKGNRCYAIATGTVKISSYTPDGREALLAVLGPGDVFGELAMFDETTRSADATALDDADLLSFDQEAITSAARRHPEILTAILAVMARRLRRTSDRMQEVAFFDVTGRLASRLAELAEQHGTPRDNGTLIGVAVSQEALASMVGATRESVNKALQSLIRRNLIARHGRRYVVPDVAALRARAR
jgi:CRP/FNR family transcriptional regulator, cyclic AMP receptor protein